MNKARRKQIEAVKDKIADAQALIAEIMEEVESIRDEEQDYLDNIPENLQASERYDAAEESVSNLDNACDELSSLDYTMESIVESLDAAAE